ncbi:MAG: hypothetical protein A2W22_05620 [Candidatus Levybacteria bacterium RBG_16_35_11]|nr:MAG: hypothetical protein A2W22_05620 [Candidatus Levybacteria bacterium RBG_16_35_11]
MEFWSFNGAKFDNLLIIKQMIRSTTDLDIIGSNTQIKMIRFKDVMFYDMILIYPGSLENVAK